MSNNSFLEMLGDTPSPELVIKPKQNYVHNDLVDAYNFMYDKPKHSNMIVQTYWFIIQRPPKGVDPVITAESHLLSLTETELKQVMKDLKLQFPVISSAKVNVVSEFNKLDEMAQYKFFTKIRKNYDDEDWAVLVGEL